MEKDHSDCKRGNPLPPLRKLLFSISSKETFIFIRCDGDSTYHCHCHTRSEALAGTRIVTMAQFSPVYKHQVEVQSL